MGAIAGAIASLLLPRSSEKIMCLLLQADFILMKYYLSNFMKYIFILLKVLNLRLNKI